MITKCTALFTLSTNVTDATATNRRIGGWSESWYSVATQIADVIAAFRTLCSRRASLLPKGAAVVGQRYQQVDPVGVSQTDSARFPGNAAYPPDIPQMSLLCKVKAAGMRNIRLMRLPGIPDEMVVEGEFAPSQGYKAALNRYFFELGNGWCFRGRNLAAVAFPLVSISDSGAYLTEVASNFAEGTIVRVLRTRNHSGDDIGGRFQVGTNPAARTGILTGWTGGACVRGRIRAETIVYPPVAPTIVRGLAGTITYGIEIGRIVTRKVGRPSEQYVGHHSARK